MNRYQIRREAYRWLRAFDYPKEDVNAAINQVIDHINNLGRFRFHQHEEDITLATDDFNYAVSAPIIAEDLVVFDPPVSPKPATKPDVTIIKKGPTLVDAIADGRFVNSGDKPSIYIRWQDQWWFDPIPNSTANGKIVRIYHFRELAELVSDVEAPSTKFSTRYHGSVLAVGAASLLAPLIQVSTDKGISTLQELYQNNLRNMVAQELWEPLTSHSLLRDDRWRDSHDWGNVETVIG